MRFDAGALFAGYTVVSRLGRGGMATVYLVREPGIERLVALKVLPEQLVDDALFAARFEQEARVIGALDHPNIIPLYRYGITDETPWMALRYVDGGDFGAWLSSPHASLSEGLAILRSVAAALDYAHRKGVIHRDLKPQNILLSRDGAAYLADFGVAKLLEQSSRMKTATGGVVGTPAYMAPEQAQGLGIGPYTDVYALAVICFQWLTGSLPFDANTPHALLVKHVSEPLPVELLQRLSPQVAAILGRALAKKPEDRIQSASAFITELEAALSAATARAQSTPTVLAPVSAAEDKSSAGVRKRLIALGLALLVCAAGFAYWQKTSQVEPQPGAAGRQPGVDSPSVAPKPESVIASAVGAAPQASIAVLPFVDMSQARDQEYFSDGLSEELLNLLARIPQLRVAARTSSFSFKGKDTKLGEIGRELNVATVLEGSVRRSGERVRITAQLINVADGYHLWSNTYDRRMTEIFAVQDEIATGIVESLKVKLLPNQSVAAASHRTSNPEAYDQYLLGRQLSNPSGRQEDYRRAVEAFTKATKLDPGFAAGYAGLAVAQVLYGWGTDAGLSDEQLKQALVLAEKAIALDPELADGYSARGYLRGVAGEDRPGALADFARALSINPNDSVTHMRYYPLLALGGRVPEAIAAAKKASELDPLVGSTWLDLGEFYNMTGQLQAAEAALHRTLDIEPQDDHAPVALGMNYLMAGKPLAALAQLEPGLGKGYGVGAYAMAQFDLGRKAESEQTLQKLLSKPNPAEIALVYTWCANRDKAFEWLERAHKEGHSLWHVKYEPWRSKLGGDPRFPIFLKKLGISD